MPPLERDPPERPPIDDPRDMLPPRLIDPPPPKDPRRLAPPKPPPERGAGARRADPPKPPPERERPAARREPPKDGALPPPIERPVLLAPPARPDTRGTEPTDLREPEPLLCLKVGVRDLVRGANAPRDPEPARPAPALFPAAVLDCDTRERLRGWNVERRLPRLPSIGSA